MKLYLKSRRRGTSLFLTRGKGPFLLGKEGREGGPILPPGNIFLFFKHGPLGVEERKAGERGAPFKISTKRKGTKKKLFIVRSSGSSPVKCKAHERRRVSVHWGVEKSDTRRWVVELPSKGLYPDLGRAKGVRKGKCTLPSRATTIFFLGDPGATSWAIRHGKAENVLK